MTHKKEAVSFELQCTDAIAEQKIEHRSRTIAFICHQGTQDLIMLHSSTNGGAAHPGASTVHPLANFTGHSLTSQ
jgi:hypothetical protein